MNAFKKNTVNEHGSVIIYVLVILGVLTIIGVSVTNMANNELKVSGNDKDYKIAFYHAEGGVYTIAKWISQVVDNNKVPAAGNLIYLDNEDQLKREAMGYELDDEEEIRFWMQAPSGAQSTVEVNFTKNRSVTMAGGGAASLGDGASSVGTGSNMGLPYWVVSTVTTSTNTTTNIIGRYLKVDGVAGGL